MKLIRKSKYKEKHREFLSNEVDAYINAGNEITTTKVMERKKQEQIKQEHQEYTKKRQARRKEYQEEHRRYIEGPIWKKRKESYYDKFYIESCQVCSSKERLQVHHNNYVAQPGCEQDEHLIVLCRPCHNLFHKNRKPSHYDYKSKSCCKLCGRDKEVKYVETNFSINEQKLEEDIKVYEKHLAEDKRINQNRKRNRILKKPTAKRGINICASCIPVYAEQFEQNNIAIEINQKPTQQKRYPIRRDRTAADI